MKINLHPGTTLFVIAVAALGALQAVQPHLTGQAAVVVGIVTTAIAALLPNQKQ